jgi:DNA-binding HxlR family transcriptional regulator
VEVTVQVKDEQDARMCYVRQILDRIGDKWSISVIYVLGQLGHTLLGTVRHLMEWAHDHADDLDEARAAYDHRAGQAV